MELSRVLQIILTVQITGLSELPVSGGLPLPSSAPKRSFPLDVLLSMINRRHVSTLVAYWILCDVRHLSPWSGLIQFRRAD